TPNPQTLKFLPGVPVVNGAPLSFDNIETAAISPLAQMLLGEDGVRGVFLGTDFISITKDSDIEWDVIKPHLLMTIMDHFTSGLPVLADDADSSNATTDAASVESDASEDITKQIIEIIDNQVRPAVAQDGGDIVLRKFKDGIVYLELYGACSNCPRSTVTLKNGIENMLKYYVPEVQSVESVS
ncbi:MAG: NifU family protein, partial [Pseudomonadota bacterium]